MRRLVALLLSFVMTLSLTACGTENGENSQADLDAKSVSEEAEAMRAACFFLLYSLG